MNKKLKIIIIISSILAVLLTIILIVVFSLKKGNVEKDTSNYTKVNMISQEGKKNYEITTYTTESGKIAKIKIYNLDNLSYIKFDEVVSKNNLDYKITEIGASAFQQHKELKGVKIPKHVTTIGQSAFISCINIENYIINDELEKIDNAAFSNNAKLKEIKFKSKLKIINDFAFQDCFELKTVYFNNKLEHFGDNVFKNCKKLTEIYYSIDYNENDEISKKLIKTVKENNGYIKFKNKSFNFKK